MPRAAHFLLVADLADSPPNRAIVQALLELGFEVDLFAPDRVPDGAAYGPRVRGGSAEFGQRWIVANMASARWRGYDLFCGTSEDPFAAAGVLSAIARRPSFLLADEIKTGSYSGDASPGWKALCRWAARRARFVIVNDDSRVPLMREYAGLGDKPVLVYPGGYHEPPPAGDRALLRAQWQRPADAFVIGASGGMNMTTGTDWLLEGLRRLPDVHAVLQPVNLDPFARFLMERLDCRERMFIEPRRLPWREAWSSAVGVDVGLAIYTNPAPQFQNMGTSSNRLCMFLTMGVPVIASRQPSFQFLERFGCGVMVGSQEEFVQAVLHVRANAAQMKENALRCAREHLRTGERYAELKRAIERAAR